MLDPQLKLKWVEALESGKYKQCKDRLHYEGKYCCLGVLAEVGKTPKEVLWGIHGVLGPNAIQVWITYYQERWNLDSDTAFKLAFMNDAGNSFNKIAAFIRASNQI
jgi:hypothetical protein